MAQGLLFIRTLFCAMARVKLDAFGHGPEHAHSDNLVARQVIPHRIDENLSLSAERRKRDRAPAPGPNSMRLPHRALV